MPSVWQRKKPAQTPSRPIPPSEEAATLVAAARLARSASSGQSSRPRRLGLPSPSYWVETKASSKLLSSSPWTSQAVVRSSPCSAPGSPRESTTISDWSPASIARWRKVPTPSSGSALQRLIWPGH